MIVSYKSGNLRNTCSKLANAEKKLGRTVASDLVSIISDIEAVTHASEISENINYKKVRTNKRIKISLGGTKTAVFVAVGQKFREHENGHPIWSTVTRLRLDEIVATKRRKENAA